MAGNVAGQWWPSLNVAPAAFTGTFEQRYNSQALPEFGQSNYPVNTSPLLPTTLGKYGDSDTMVSMSGGGNDTPLPTPNPLRGSGSGGGLPTLDNEIDPSTGMRFDGGDIIPGGATKSSGSDWTVFGFDVARMIVVILGIVFIAAALWSFTNRSITVVQQSLK